MNRIGIYRLHEGIEIPEIKTQNSACFDLKVDFKAFGSVVTYDEDNEKGSLQVEGGKLRIPPRRRVMIPMGFILDIPEGYSVRIHPRSSVALKRGLMLVNQEAVIDNDFVEELQLLIWNSTDTLVSIENGERIAQGELVRMEEVHFENMTYRPLQKTDRQGGIGSTGKR